MVPAVDATTHPPAHRRPGRGSRLGLLALAALLIGYALSDDSFLGSAPGFGRMQQVLAALGAALLASTLLPPRWRTRTLLIAATTLVACVAAELALRPLLGPRLFQPFTNHDQWIFTLAPDRVADFQHDAANGNRIVRYTINADGFRGEPLRTDGKAVRVAVYGDSFIQAIYSDLPATFGEQLERRLGDGSQRDVEVVNCGVASFGPDQSLRKLRSDLPTLRPDFVVFAIFTGNDFGDLQRNKLYRLDAAGALTESAWELLPELRDQFAIGTWESALLRAARRVFRPTESGIDANLLAGADGGTALLERWLAINAEEHADYAKDSVVRNVMVDHFNADCALTPTAESAVLRRRLMAGVLAQLRGTVEAAGVPCLVLIVPYVLDVCPRADFRVDPTRWPDYRPRNLSAAVVAACEQSGLPYFDLFDTMATTDCATLFLAGWDDHWSDAGQAAAAAALAAHMLSNSLLPAQRR